MDPTDRFVEAVRNPTPDIHLDVLAALIGVSFEPDAMVDDVVAALDHLAADCEPTFDGVLRQFHHHLTGNTADYGDPRNSYLHAVLHRGLGIPITLSIVAIELGRRLEVPIEGVGLPGHFMVRCGERFADPFHLGRVFTVDELEPEWQRMTGIREPLDRRLLGSVTSRGVVLRMLNNLKATFVAMDDPVPLRTLARLRGAFPELAHEHAEYARWLRHWN